MGRRSNRQTKMKRRRQLKRFRLCILIIFFVSTSVFAFKFIDKDKGINEAISMEYILKKEVEDSSNILVPKIEHKDQGDIESIIEYGDNGLIGAHYPVFGKDNIDEINKELVGSYIKEFKDELASNAFRDKDYKYELSIDYETYTGPNDIISINFNITESSSYLAHPAVRISTKVYDLSNDSEIQLDDIMKDDYLKYISQLSESYFNEDETYRESVNNSLFKEGIYPSKENYSNFILKEDRILFIFSKYQLFSGNFGMPSIEIAYQDLKEYIDPNLFQKPSGNGLLEKLDKASEKEIAHMDVVKRLVDPSKPMIALTFDDGPNKMTTLPILDSLREYEAAATFFVLGNRVSNNVDILKRMLEEGSEIGNHSYSHKELTKLSSQELMEQILNTQDAVSGHTGVEPKIMRPTYGSYDENLKANIDMPLILWSIDTLDWKSRSAKKVTDHVLANVKDGDIVLMHDIYESTVDAVKVLVPKLIDQGYQLVTVSELFEARGELLESGHIYNKSYKNKE